MRTEVYKLSHTYTINGRKYKAIEILTVKSKKGMNKRVTFQNLKNGFMYEKAQRYRNG